MSKADAKPLKMFVVPCSCGTTFAVAENYDRQGTAWGRYLKCPTCEKRHDPRIVCCNWAISERDIGRWTSAK